MKYINISEGKWVEVDEEKNLSRVIITSDIEAELAESEARLAEIPNDPTDTDLLEWARSNYPKVDYSVEKQHLQDLINKNSLILSEIK